MLYLLIYDTSKEIAQLAVFCKKSRAKLITSVEITDELRDYLKGVEIIKAK